MKILATTAAAVLVAAACTGGCAGATEDVPDLGTSDAELSLPRDLVVYTRGDVARDARIATRATVLLAGGGRDDDAAMRALVDAGGRGDVVVLRMDDTRGAYADYFDDLGARSVREIVFDRSRGNDDVTGGALARLRSLADDRAVARAIDRAEIVFFAGGNQTKYVDAFRGTRLAGAVTRLVARGGAIGGTSAGTHVLGGIVHTPRGGGASVLSDDALEDPYIGRGELRGSASLELEPSPFSVPLFAGFVFDTHWSERARLGRSMVFLARVIEDGMRPWDGAALLACDEGVAVVTDVATRTARIYGPRGSAATFARADAPPDRCEDDRPLAWRRGATLVRVPASARGDETFDLDAFRGGPGATTSRFTR